MTKTLKITIKLKTKENDCTNEIVKKELLFEDANKNLVVKDSKNNLIKIAWKLDVLQNLCLFFVDESQINNNVH